MGIYKKKTPMKRKHIKKIIIGIVALVIIIPIGLMYYQQVRGASVSWVGGSGDWETGSNWSGGSEPGPADDVTIDANVTVTINASTTINKLTLGNASGTTTPTLIFDYDGISSGALIIDDDDLIIYSGATVTHTDASGGTINGRINFDVQSGNTTISGTIDVDNKGYEGGYCASGSGTGGGTGAGTGNTGGGGAGHGGEGADGYYSAGAVRESYAVPPE